MTVQRDWELEYDVDDVLLSQAADPAVIRSRRPKLVELSQRAFEEGRMLVEPAVMTRTVKVEETRHNRVTLENGSHLTGPLITEHLGGAQEVVVMVCTIGDKLGKVALEKSKSNLSYGFALDAVGSAAVYALNAAACNQIESEANASGMQTSLPLSPGMDGWGVDPGQREVFSLIDPQEIGVVLSPTLEMLPLKSVTTLVGVGPQIATKGAICDYCPLRHTCRHKTT